MGWGLGLNKKGRAIGYGVRAVCDEPGCKKKIHRGLDYVCGGMHDGDEHGCGDYFCYDHLLVSDVGQLCKKCYQKYALSEDRN